MKQQWEEKCLKLLLWELLVFLNSCAKFWFLPSSLCKMTSASEYFLLISTILVMRLPLCYQEVSGSMVFGKSQIRVSERSGAQFALWAAWGLRACFPRSSPSSWNKQEFVGTACGASQRRGLSEYWEPGSSLSPAKATQTWCEGDTSTVCAACLSSHGTSAKGLLEPFISIREM